jgi:large subunit ribosomal protein L4
LNDKKVLLVLPQSNKNIYLSSRNIEKNKVVTAIDVNTYDVLNANKVVLIESAVSVLENNLLKK